MILKTLSMGKQPVYYVQKSYRNENVKPSTKYVERLGTLEDLEKRFGGEDPIGYLFLQKVYHELGLDKICRTWCY